MSIRAKINDELKAAMHARDQQKVNALRLINASIKDKDIASRTEENRDGIGDDAILSLMQSMIKQRRESAEIYRGANRQDLVDKEEGEIVVIEAFMPKQLSDAEVISAIDLAIKAIGATSIKDMGKVMAELKSKYAGQMDFSKAGALVKDKFK